jgi:cytochrome P450
MALAPGVTQWFPLPYGQFGALLTDPIGFHQQARVRFGDVVRFRVGPIVIHFLYHPDHVRRVLFDNPKNYLRGWQYRLLGNLFGDNLVAAEGPSWLRQRRLAQPPFHRQRLAGYANVMLDSIAQLLSRWNAAAAVQNDIDVAPEMSRLALAIASRTLFDQDVSQEADRVGKAFRIVGQYLEMRFNNSFTSLPSWVPTATNRRFKQAVRTLFELVLTLIQERRREGRDHGDLLSMLMMARDEETGESMTDQQLRSQALTFLIAGHETTAIALTWTWYLLASHAAIRHQVRIEVEAVLGERPPTISDVGNLHATRRVIEESMRLYPPVWTLPRHLVEDDEIGGFLIPRGSMIVLVPYMTHRHPEFWHEPDLFDPGRFAPEQTTERPKGAYFPFLGGPHQCIGNEFAMIEMQLIVAMVLRQFDLEIVPNQSIQPRTSIQLRPNGPVRMILKPMDRRTYEGLDCAATKERAARAEQLSDGADVAGAEGKPQSNPSFK